jgi:hypothetical protein
MAWVTGCFLKILMSMNATANALATETLATADFETAKTTEKENAGTMDSAIPSGPPMASRSD